MLSVRRNRLLIVDVVKAVNLENESNIDRAIARYVKRKLVPLSVLKVGS
jgi:hypothetical protein